MRMKTERILGSWSGMRKYLEKEMLAPSLAGRLRYGCTAYVGMDGCHIFTVAIDGEEIKRFSLETVNTYFIENGYKENNEPYGIGEYWQGFWHVMDKMPLLSRTEYTCVEFAEALDRYRNQAIQDSVCAENPLVRMFAVLDRRVGKRTLAALKETLDDQPEWLKRFYTLRFDAEGI